MAIIIGFIVLCFMVILFMWRQANENNVRMHVVKSNAIRDNARLFFISDTHTRKISKAMIKRIEKPIDAVIIGGDFVDKRTSKKTMHENLQLLQTLAPIYFVWGNNDHEIDVRELKDLFQQYQVRIVENEAVLLQGDNSLTLSAVSFNPSKEKIEKAITTCDERSTVFIAHNPELFRKVYKQFTPLVSMGGHLHGGQIRFGKYGIHPNGYFRKLQNHYELVSNGYGTSLLPLRLGAKPECHILDIQFEHNEPYSKK